MKNKGGLFIKKDVEISDVEISQFVDILLNKNWQEKQEDISEGEKSLLIKVLKYARFYEVEGVAFGKVSGWFRDEDGPTGDTYHINIYCPFKAMNKEGNDAHYATGWLESIFSRLISKKRQETSMEELILEVRKYLPLRMYISESGVVLEVSSKQSEGENLRIHKNREDILNEGEIGKHYRCGGKIARDADSEEFDAVTCSRCFLRELIPREIETYGELEEYFKKKYFSGED